MALLTNADIAAARNLVAAVGQAGGDVPQPLTNILEAEALLARPHPIPNPAQAIVSCAADGSLTEQRLDELIESAARAQVIANYRADLRLNTSARLFVNAFYEQLQSGAADEVLSGLRPAFTNAAEQISAAREVIPPSDVPAEQFLATPSQAAVTLWKQLPGLLATITRVAAVASAFGPKGHFPLIATYAQGDGHLLHDVAIFCANGPSLEADSKPFLHPDRGHRDSPYLRVPLRLATVAEAVERYRIWAEGQREMLHAGPATKWVDPQGGMHDQQKPENPYRATALAK